jgi:hypothetical protein
MERAQLSMATMGPAAQPDEIAAAISWLASDETSNRQRSDAGSRRRVVDRLRTEGIAPGANPCGSDINEIPVHLPSARRHGQGGAVPLLSRRITLQLK